jgi:excisionase family DNA binding protein
MQRTGTLPDVLTPDQAAEYLQVNRETIYRYIRDGKLDASRLGRSYRVPRRNLELLLLATRTRPYVKLREYTDEQVAQFIEDDALDGEALDVARRFDQATGGMFFGEDRSDAQIDPSR